MGNLKASVRNLPQLYQIVDARAAQLEQIHAARLHCGRGCSACCVDDLTVFEVEARSIQTHYAELLRDGVPHPVGACAFLATDGSCRIYAHRPYVCRTQGLPLRWLEEDEMSEEVYELRDICPLNEAGPPVEELPAEDCWTLGPAEETLAHLQAQINAKELRRVALRDLFASR